MLPIRPKLPCNSQISTIQPEGRYTVYGVLKRCIYWTCPAPLANHKPDWFGTFAPVSRGLHRPEIRTSTKHPDCELPRMILINQAPAHPHSQGLPGCMSPQDDVNRLAKLARPKGTAQQNFDLDSKIVKSNLLRWYFSQ